MSVSGKLKRLAVTERLAKMGVPVSPLELTQHALVRFVERTGLEKDPNYNGPNYSGVMLSITLAKPEVVVEKFIDTSAGDALTEFHIIPEGKLLWPRPDMNNKDHELHESHIGESAILRSAPSLVAVVRQNTVVTILPFDLYQNNKNVGMYLQPGMKPLPLTSNTMEQQMTLAKNAREWATSYFAKNPTASVHEALKAANNAGQPPVKSVFSAVKTELRIEAEKQRELERKAELEKAKEVPKVPKAKDPAPPAPPWPLKLPTGHAESAPAVQSIPEPKTEATKVLHDAAVREVAREAMEASGLVEPKATPEERIRAQAKALLEVMREARMESLILTITDRAPKPNASWEVTYHRSTAGEFDL